MSKMWFSILPRLQGSRFICDTSFIRKVDYHTSYTCAQYQQWSLENGQADQKFEDFVSGSNFKRCPGCKKWVEKNLGCGSTIVVRPFYCLMVRSHHLSLWKRVVLVRSTPFLCELMCSKCGEKYPCNSCRAQAGTFIARTPARAPVRARPRVRSTNRQRRQGA